MLIKKKDNGHPLKIYAACGCNKGLRRLNNEDNFYFVGKYLDVDNNGLDEILTWTGEMTERQGVLFSVYDGMGGGQYGEIASHTAAECTAVCIEEYVHRYDEEDDITSGLSEMCEALNDEVFKAGQALIVNQMGSTLAGFFFQDNNVWCCNVGDSRCYRLRDGQFRQMSVDHTDEETMKLSGVTGRKPYLTQYLGVDSEEMRICPFVIEDTVMEGDHYLICSDGLSDMVSTEKISEILQSESDVGKAVQKLISEALISGGRDNITVIVCGIKSNLG